MKKHKPYWIISLICLLMLLSATVLFADDTEIEDDLYQWNPKVINLPTLHRLDKGAMDFDLTHRFRGSIKESYEKKDNYKGARDVLGIDNGAQMGFGFKYGILDNWNVGIYRTTLLKTYELSTQVTLLNELEEGEWNLVRKNWFSLGLRAGFAIPTEPGEPSIGAGNFQLILSKRVSSFLWTYLVPGYTTRSQYSYSKKDVVSTGIGVSIVPSLKSGIRINGEYTIANTGFNQYKNSWGVGFVIVTGEHVFNIILTNTLGTTLDYYTQAPSNEVRLGFNLTRRFFPFTEKKAKEE